MKLLMISVFPMNLSATILLGQRIKSLRLAKKWTQANLAEALSCDPITVSRYERGEYAPSIETLLEISKALKVSPADLFPGFDSPTNESLSELRHTLCDLAYKVGDPDVLKAIVAQAKKIIESHK